MKWCFCKQIGDYNYYQTNQILDHAETTKEDGPETVPVAPWKDINQTLLWNLHKFWPVLLNSQPTSSPKFDAISIGWTNWKYESLQILALTYLVDWTERSEEIFCWQILNRESSLLDQIVEIKS